MQYVYRFGIALATAAMFQTAALADKFDACPDPDAARRYVKSCLQENPYYTQATCEARALDKLCGGK